MLKNLYVSLKMTIFAMWFEKEPRHWGELLSFDPSENPENSKYAGEKSESRCEPKAEQNLFWICWGEARLIKSCFSCSSIYTAYSAMESAHINTCRCELISFLRTQVFQRSATKETLSKRNRRKNLVAKKWQVGSHSLCLNGITI